MIKRYVLDIMKPLPIYPWIVWFIGATFFMIEYVARISPAVMRKSLLSDFDISSGQFGSLSAIFQMVYIAMQLPVGILTDRLGAGYLLGWSILVCALASLGFSASESLFQAQLARFFMGLSGSFAFVCTLKLATTWFSQSRLGLLAGMTQIMGMIGGASGSMVLPYGLQLYGWRYMMAMIALSLALVYIACCLFVCTDKTSQLGGTGWSRGERWYDSLLFVCQDKQTWINASIAGLIYLPTAVIGELWGPMFFEQVYGLTDGQAARATGWIFVGWGVGGALNGWCSDWLLLRRPTLIVSAGCCVLLLLAILFSPSHSVYSLSLMCCIYGFFNTGVVTAYAVATELNPKKYTGTSIAFTNMISILYGVMYIPVFGYLLDYFWDGKQLQGDPIYALPLLYGAVLILPLAQSLACYLSIYHLKETGCRSYEHRQDGSDVP